MGWTNAAASVLQANTVIVIAGQPNTGIFVYSGTPATGNLVGSWAAAAGTDPYNNAYPNGICSFNSIDPNRNITLDNGTIYIGPPGSPASAGEIQYTTASDFALILKSGVSGGGTDSLTSVRIPHGTFGAATGSGNACNLEVISNDPQTAADIYCTGNLYQITTGGVIEGWTAATLSGVTGDSSASMLAGIYTRPTGTAGLVAVTGSVHATTNIASGTVIATGLPATASKRAYVQCTNNLTGGGGGFSNPMFFVDSSGQGTYYGSALVSGNTLYLSGIYPVVGV